MKKSLLSIAVAVLICAVPVSAEVYFWPAGTDTPCSPAAPSDQSGTISPDYCTVPGSGFVGKGDVQDAFGWNNKQLQTNASSVTFTYGGTQRWTQTCWKLAGNPDRENALKTHSFKRELDSSASFDGSARGNKQESVTGFWLLGYGDGGGSSEAPTDLCPAFGEAHGVEPGPWLNYNPNDPNETSVPELDGEGSGTELCVHFGASSYCWSID